MVGVVAELSWEVKGDAETSFSLRNKKLESSIGLFGATKTRVLSHRPQSFSVHFGVDPACEWVFAGCGKVSLAPGYVFRSVNGLDLEP